jgi:hypothetical protein
VPAFVEMPDLVPQRLVAQQALGCRPAGCRDGL